MMRGLSLSANRLKPFYGRRQVRKLCYRLELKVDVRTAERDHYREALRRIAYPETFLHSRSVLSRIAREALDG